MKARLPKGMGGGNMNDIMRQAQKMQEQIGKRQAELEEQEWETESGGGVVKIKINGKKEIVSLSIDPALVDPSDIDMLEYTVMTAVNEAVSKVEEITSEELGKITGGGIF